MSCFIDTSGLYAMLDRDDSLHDRAKAAWRSLLESDEILVTSNYVVAETIALVQDQIGVKAVRRLVDDVVPALQSEWIDPDDHRNAVLALVASGKKKLSLVDCSSFEVMRRLGIRRVLTFDRQFAEQGFELVR